MPSLVPFRVPKSWSIFSPTRPSATFISLPNDIIVDRIFSFLEVQDILCLRRVCKHLYNLTHHAVIWKRLLRTTRIAVPPLPPTTRHCLRNLTALEAERLMVRSVSLATRFKWQDPVPSDVWRFNAYHKISQMVLLPGSQYMVASVSEMNGTNWSLIVFVMDGRYSVVPLAKMSTESKAYNLAAKYMTVDGVAGITIAYDRRAWRHRGDGLKGLDINDYSGEYKIDPAYPVKYECHAVHVPLAELDTICDPRFVPGSQEFIEYAASLPAPFHRLCLIRSTRELGAITLDVIRGKPHLTVVRNPCTLMFKPLDGGPASTLTMNRFGEFHRYEHRILAFRHLPAQNQTLVVRFIDVPETRTRHSVASLEFYAIPHNLTDHPIEETAHPTDFCFLYEDKVERAFITDYGQPNWFNEDPESDTPAALHARYNKDHEPPPIHIYFRAVEPDEGLLRVTFYPQRMVDWVPPSPASSTSSSPVKGAKMSSSFVNVYRYTIDHASPARFVMAMGDTSYRVLPGVQNSLVYSVPLDDRSECPDVMEVFRYYDKEMFAKEPEEFIEGQPERRRPLKKLDMRMFQKLGKGCRAFAWDDYIGRLVWTVEGTSQVYVVDYSKRPKEDLYGRRMPLAAEQDHEVDPADIDLLFPEDETYEEY